MYQVPPVSDVTGVLFFHRLLFTPVGELLMPKTVQLRKAAALQEIQHAVNSSTEAQIPVVDSNGVQAKLFLYSFPKISIFIFLKVRALHKTVLIDGQLVLTNQCVFVGNCLKLKNH